MSLITRCPACATTFKVVPDQLRISAGWVRCGVCAEVFDASGQILLASESKGMEVVASVPVPVEAKPLSQQPDTVALSSSEPESSVGDSDQNGQGSEAPNSFGENFQTPPVMEVADVAEPNEAAEPQSSVDLVRAQQAEDMSPPRANTLFVRPANLGALESASEPEKGLPEVGRSPDSGSAQTHMEPAIPRKAGTGTLESETESWLDAIAEDASAEEEALEPSEHEVPSFVRQAQRRAFWSSRGVRLTLWLVLLLIALGLGWQWAVSQRDWLAAREPRLTPLLELLCQPSGCTIAPYRDLKAIVIDGSSFQRVSVDSFQLNFGLRNNGDLPVATPSLQLTLTDAQNQALLQREFRAQDLSAPPTLAAQGEFNGTSSLSVDVPDPTAIVGYRLVAFYP